MARQDDVKKLIARHSRRLQKLKELQARKGIDTEPHILIEIEDLEAEIDVLQAELDSVSTIDTPDSFKTLSLSENHYQIALHWAESGRQRSMSRFDLRNTDLRMINLNGANLSLTNLARCNLTAADLTSADLRFSDLSEANLTGANLTNADLTEADLRKANLSGANLTEANLSRANLTNANLRKANMTKANLGEANVTGANFEITNLFGSNLKEAYREGSPIQRVIDPKDAYVLVVEDSLQNLVLIARLLAFIGVRRYEYMPSGWQLLDFAASMPRVDLILMDIHLPYEDGFDVLAKLRSDTRFDETLVIAITADANPSTMEKAQKLGFDGFLGKPIDPDIFPDQILNILQGNTIWDLGY